LRRDTPVTFGVAGPDTSAAEARERIEKCAGAADAAIDLAAALPDRGQQ
jgi:6,7-dimethyl-8-ribityllumazine synthase